MNSPASKAIFVGLDGASMELVQNMVSWGCMPNLAKLIRQGVHRPMLGTFPTLTPPGWTSLFTGSWPGTHGITDFSIRIPGKALDETEWGINTNLSKSEYLWNTFERAGKKPILIKVEMSWPPTVSSGIQVEGTGPGASNYHQIAGYHFFVAGKWTLRSIGGQVDPESVDPSALQGGTPVDSIQIETTEGKNWQNLPSSTLPLLETTLEIQPLKRGRPNMIRGEHGEPRFYYGLILASGDKGYDRIRICKSRNANDSHAEIGIGEWSDFWVDSFTIDGVELDGYVRCKLLSLSPDGKKIELFFPQIWPTTGYAVPDDTTHLIHKNIGFFLQNPGRDALGVVDDDTYFELLEDHHECLTDIAHLMTASGDWDLLMIETHASDFASHFFLGQADEICGAPPHVIQRCRSGLERTYQSMDRMIGRIMEIADKDCIITVCSDHGGTPNKYPMIEIMDVLKEKGFVVFKEDDPQQVDWSRTRAYPVGLTHIFINLKGREPHGIVEPEDYSSVQQEIIAALHSYEALSGQDGQEIIYNAEYAGEDFSTSLVPKIGEHPFSLAVTHDDAELLNLWGELVGDVVYALRPEFDGAHGFQLPSASLGIGGQHSTFVLSGAGVRSGVALKRQVRVIDVAPTICYLLGIPMPRDIEGGVIYEALEDPDWHLTALKKSN